MTKKIFKLCVFFLFLVPLVACETEQTNTKSSSSIVTYNEDFAKKQSQLMNEEALKKAPVTGTSVIMDGRTHPISDMTITNNTQ